MTRKNKLASYRTLLNNTQKDIAKLLNVSSTAYSKKESGKTSFKDSEKITLVNYFKENGINTSLEELFF